MGTQYEYFDSIKAVKILDEPRDSLLLKVDTYRAVTCCDCSAHCCCLKIRRSCAYVISCAVN